MLRGGDRKQSREEAGWALLDAKRKKKTTPPTPKQTKHMYGKKASLDEEGKIRRHERLDESEGRGRATASIT